MVQYMKKATLLLLRKIIILGICLFVGIALLAGSYLITQRSMFQNVWESAITLYREGLGRYIWEDSKETMLDNFTDGLILNEAYTYDEDGVLDILLNPCMQVDETNPMNSLYEVVALANDDFETNYYGRYWHGYLAVIRPLLLFFNYTEIRHLLMMLQLFLILFFLWKAARSDEIEAVIPLIGFWLFLSPATLFGSLQYAPCFLITMLMLIVLYRWKEGTSIRRSDLFLLAGIATAYFDFLIYPLVTLGVPLLFYLSMDRACLLSAKRALQNVLTLSFSWGGGTLPCGVLNGC